MGVVRLRVGRSRRHARLLRAGRSASRRSNPAPAGTPPGSRTTGVLVELVAAPGRAAAAARARPGSFHLAILVPDRARLGRRAAAHRRSRVGPHRRLGPPRERGPLHAGPGGERDRDLPRPPARGVAASADGELEMDSLPLDLAPIAAEGGGRRPDGARDPHGPRAPERRRHPGLGGLLQRPPGLRADGALPTRVRCSSRPAATTTTSASTPGPARVRPHRSRAAWGSRASTSSCRTQREVDAIAARLEDAGLAVERSDGGIKVADPSSNVVVVRASQAS